MANASINASVRAETKQFEQGMERAKKQNQSFLKSAINASRGMSKAASISGAAFSSLSAGISAAQASGESFESAMVSAGASVAAAFAAGGPVGAGLAVLSIGIGSLVGGMNNAEKKAKEMEKAFEDAFRKAADGAEKARDELGKLEVRILEIEHTLAGDPLNMDRFSQGLAIKEQIGRVEELEKAYQRATEAAEVAARKRREQLAIVRQNEEFGVGTEGIGGGGAGLAAANQEFARAQALATAQRDALEAERKRLDALRRIFDLTAEEAKQKAEIKDVTEDIHSAQRGVTSAVAEEAGFQVDMTKVLTQKLQLIDRYTKSAERAADAARRESEHRKRLNDGLDMELRLLRAGSDVERERIRLEEWRKDQLEAGADAEKVALVYAEKMKQLLEEQRGETEARAEAEETVTKEVAKQQQAMKQLADITKRFAAAPGTNGVFGFGAGQVGFGGFQGGQVRRRRRRAPKPGPDAAAPPQNAGGLGAPPVQDLSPEIQEATAALKGIGEMYAKLGASITEQSAEAKRVYQETAKVTVSTVQKLRADLADVRASLKSLESSLSRAGSGSLAGG